MAVEEVVVAFRGMAAGWALWVESEGPSMEGLASWEEPEAEFEGEDSELVSRAKGSRESLPVDGFDHIISPFEAFVHVGFKKTKAVLAADRCREFAGHSDAAKRELHSSGWKERYQGAGCWKLSKLVGG